MYNYMACWQPKMSHIKKEILENILKKLNEKFGKESSLMTNSGKFLEYLCRPVSGEEIPNMSDGQVPN